MFYKKQISKFFKFDSVNATFKKEIIGGLTTFLAMVYILSVQPSILSQSPSINPANGNMNFGGIFIATAIAPFVGTVIMGLSANLPVGLAPSMGLNAVFTFNVAKNGIGYEGALIAVMISALLFCLVSATKIRILIMQSIPQSMKLAIGTGIGFFIAYIGFKDIGLVSASDSGLPIASLSQLKNTWPLILIGVAILSLIFILYFKKIPGAIAIAILCGLVISLIIGNVGKSEFIKANFAHWTNWSYSDFSSWKINFSNTYHAISNPKIWTSPTMYIAIFVFLFVSFFDTTGTLYSISHQISDQTGINYQLKKNALMADSFGTLTGSLIGCSPITTYVESSTGVAQGARTGFSSLIIAIMFLVAIVLYPLFKLITPCISGSCLIFVGSLMIKQLKDIEWVIPEISIAAFFTIITMIITYSITNGIAIGYLAYTLTALVNKKYKDVHIITYMLDVLFIGYFAAYAFVQ
ncbi:NCS2 family permease [Spiroplasma sp. AdecLV25b]|uniref:NCS2 family permease n=1 Tax=Spiroplasma sp. AdecLV25b TaxID=3027162 RepID=UPI0027E0E495|nr:NCS2 family permease [Spiroplasma sp. AdecLV25b]